MVCSAAKAKALGLTTIATITPYANPRQPPTILRTGPTPASQRRQTLAGCRTVDLDLE